MKTRSFKQDILILLACFIVSRMIIKLAGVTLDYNALYEYWQYLDVTSLKANLLSSLWYQHSQPPVFNLILGIILKISGSYSENIMQCFLLAVSFLNASLLLSILRKVTNKSILSLCLTLIYLLSPATMLFENELFYTTFISLLLLVAVYFLIKFSEQQSWQHIIGTFTALSLLCLTRSMYHLLWLIVISAIFVFVWRRKNGIKKIIWVGICSVTIVSGWYLKNYFLFDNFSVSSWVGMNFSRVVFHNEEVTNADDIASIPPFMPPSYYNDFIKIDYKKKYAGLNDQVLLSETKNDRYINTNNACYLELSKKYLRAGLDKINTSPSNYIKNSLTAFVIFFTPASSYYKVKKNNSHIRYYDMIYSFNPSHLFSNDHAKKRSLAVAAIPKFFLYILTFFILIKRGMKSGVLSFLNIFILITILFSLTVSSLLEYGENMRFRFEIEPLFLILLAQVLALLKPLRTIKQEDKIAITETGNIK